MKHILVAGGAGGVGEAIVRALLVAGHRVFVPSRSAARLARLRADTEHAAAGRGELIAFTGEIGTLDGAVAIRDRIVGEAGRIDTLIPSLGGWWEGGLLDASPAVWDTVMDEMLRTHYVFAHVFLPVLRAQGHGRYIGIGGGAAYHPVRNSTLVSIAAAAQLMLTRALRLEIPESEVDVLELVVDAPIRTRDSAGIAESHWIDSNDVATIAVELVAYGRTRDPRTSTAGPIVRMRP